MISGMCHVIPIPSLSFYSPHKTNTKVGQDCVGETVAPAVGSGTPDLCERPHSCSYNTVHLFSWGSQRLSQHWHDSHNEPESWSCLSHCHNHNISAAWAQLSWTCASLDQGWHSLPRSTFLQYQEQSLRTIPPDKTGHSYASAIVYHFPGHIITNLTLQ